MMPTFFVWPVSVILARTLPLAAMAVETKTTITTQQAADAKKREGQTGTTNEGAAKQMKALEEQERKTAKPPAKAASK